nr:HD domain-containing phosphohydrolase [uncultured Acetatifactor sp.]
MKLIRIDELKGDEVLAKPIMTWDYQLVLPEGATLKKEYIEKIIELGIFNVYIKEEELKQSEILILKSELKDNVRLKVKDILERHTYQNNQELEELSNTADNIIYTMLEEEQIVEKVFDIRERSSDIYEHSISTCSLAILTAMKLNVDKNIIHDIGVGCLLHDIGLRYTTVNFVGRALKDMSKQEAAEYKKHPVYGFSALKKEKWISKISKNIILYHHERLNGSGFPLRTGDIPFECRIVNVCDAFDEMICGIACQRAKVYEAVEYLKNFKNILFDDKVVDVFLSFTAVYPIGTHVLTNEGELGVVLSQNKNFNERPVIRIIKDKNGNDVKETVIKNLMEIHSIYIEKVLD